MKTFRKYWAIFEITLLNSLAYPGELIGRSLMILPFMWIYFQLWNVTFKASGTNVINSMTLYSTMWYLMMAETIELSRPALARTISDNVKDGSIAYILNKPYSFLLYQFSKDVAPFMWIYQKFIFILGGFLIPLDFYPSWLQVIAKALPFSAMIYGPSKLFIQPSWALLSNVLLLQAVWIIALGTTLLISYRRGITYLTVNGG